MLMFYNDIIFSYLTKRRKFELSYLVSSVLGSLVSVTGELTHFDHFMEYPKTFVLPPPHDFWTGTKKWGI